MLCMKAGGRLGVDRRSKISAVPLFSSLFLVHMRGEGWICECERMGRARAGRWVFWSVGYLDIIYPVLVCVCVC
jgi:hypothetical protein